jgi:tetratricopeptide (TPR) repeat protein
MGILYATYSLLPEAEEWFLKALKDDYMPAAVNLGNVAFLKEDYEAAVRYFSQALEYRPSHRGALIGLARAKYELDVFTEADELYQQIKEIDPELAERYSYLSSQVEGSVSRASSAADRKGDLLWDEQE